MKAFDIELAKANHPIQTRNGKSVRIICYNRKEEDFPIVALIDYEKYEDLVGYTIEGHYYITSNSELDLFMAPIKKEGWINVNKTAGGHVYSSATIYNSKEQALDKRNNDCIETIKIEWEE